MINKTVVIIGSVALLGVGAYIYFKPKATDLGIGGAGTTSETGTGSGDLTNNSGTNPVDNTVVQTTDNVTNEPLKNPIVRTLTNTDILAIQKLRDDILASIRNIATYKKESSRNNARASMNDQFKRLQTYGYSLDTNNNLIKIVPNDSGDDIY